ncbi:MAG: 3-methyl-2-oxobutanoate hydroxymethyltransferase [Candidatus Kaelpia imicola]|nr:3-methyl-2-oxobutanoate hydroxymethyltransferase [Candidatus Kaelpia imicola]
MAKLTIPLIKDKKEQREKITMLTAYDYPTARLTERAEIDMVLVGDSLGNVILGYDSTLPVTMDEMLHHTKAVRRGAKNTFLIADMPFMSYQVSNEEALRNGGRFIKESGADAVKLEGAEIAKDRIETLIKAGIPVLGHLGLTPQTAAILGAYKVQGRELSSAKKIYKESLLLDKLGCFAIVLECVPQQLAKIITGALSIPTIGIGAGKDCDGQVLVTYDMLGIGEGEKRKFVREYLNLEDEILEALKSFKSDVLKSSFPSQENSFNIDKNILEKLKKDIEVEKGD